MLNLLILSILAIIPFPLTYLIPYPLALAYILPLLYQIYRLKRGKPVFLKEKTIEILSFFCLFFFIIDSIFISRRLIIVAIHLTMGLILIKSFNLKTEKDKNLYAILIFFLISAGIANSFHITLFLYLLLCLFFFLRYLLEENEIEKGKVNLFSTATIFGALLFSIPLFIFFPRVKAPYMPGLGFGGEQVMGENELSLNDIENLKRGNEIIMRVKLDRKIEREGDIYIRYKTFCQYSKGVWSQPKQEYKFIRADNFGYFEFSEKPAINRAEIFSRVLMQNLPLPYGVVSIEIPLEFVNLSRDGTFLLPSGWQRRKLKFSVNLNEEVFLFKPSEPIKEEIKKIDSERIKDLAKEIFGGEENNFEKIEKIKKYFYKNYDYGVENIDLETFLFEKKRGHCELFATACVLLLREGGIPSRIVTGWLGGEKHPWQNYLIVRSSNSHAWVEAWVEGKWVLVDPTPPSFRPRIFEGNIQDFIKYFYESLSFFWDRNILGFTYLE
ncbi:MAG: transglutaminaseTgpA domain-containing protein, partial [Thermoanaerobaculia bacterium]